MLVIKEEALEDIRRAQLWYDAQQPGLGERFRSELREGLRFVVENPPGYAVRRGPYRAIVLARFPYVVWYAVEGEDTVVYRVRHGKQRPLRKLSSR